MSMVSTITPQADGHISEFSFPDQGPTTRSKNSNSLGVLPLDGGSESPAARPRRSSGAPSRGHAHRRSAAISHDFSDLKSLIPERPKTMYSLKGASMSGTSFSNSSSTSLGDNETTNSTGSNDNHNYMTPPRQQRVSFVADVDLYRANTTIADSAVVSPKSPSSSSTTRGGQPQSQNVPPIVIGKAAHRVVSSRSFDFSETENAKLSKSKTKRRRHKRVKSWAGSLIRLGGKKDNGEHSHDNGHKVSEVQTTPSSSPPSSAASSPTMVPAIIVDNVSPDSSSNDCPSPINDRRYTWSEPEPIIDLDAALSPFRKSFSLEAEFGSNLFFQHKRSESAPESVLALGLRGFRTKAMRSVAEESEEADEPSDEQQQPHQQRTKHKTSTCIEEADPTNTSSLNNIITNNNNNNTKPLHISSRYTKYSQGIGSSPKQQQQPQEPRFEDKTSGGFSSAYNNSRSVFKTSAAALYNHSSENLSPTTSLTNTPATLVSSPPTPLVEGEGMGDAPSPAAGVKVVTQLSELDEIPSIASLSGRVGSGGFGEPGPELRCSVDVSRKAMARPSVSESLSQMSTITATSKASKRRSMPVRLLDWIKRR